MKHMRRLVYTSILLLALAASSQAEIVQVGQNAFVASIPSPIIDVTAGPNDIGKQRGENWCWAAVAQMVLNYHGVIITQEDIVQRIKGRQVDETADPEEILRALNGWGIDWRGRASVVTTRPYALTSSLIDDLARRWPLVVGLQNDDGSGHANLLTGVGFHYQPYLTRDFLNRPVWTQVPVYDFVILRDPAQSRPSKQVMSWSEFISRKILLYEVFVVRL